MKQRKAPPIFGILLSAWTVIFVALPLCYIVLISFMTRSQSWGVEMPFTLQNYAVILDPVYLKVLGQSLVISLETTLITLLIGYPFSYILSKQSRGFHQTVLLLLMAPFWINSLVRMYGWVVVLQANGVINSALMTLGAIKQPLRLLYNYQSVLLGMSYAMIPIMILSIYSSVEKMDWTLVEAARDLGASPWRAFYTVTLPQTIPGIIAGCILVFLPSMGLYFIADLMSGGKVVLLGNTIKNEMLNARNWPVGAALSCILLGAALLGLWLYRRIAKTNSLEALV